MPRPPALATHFLLALLLGAAVFAFSCVFHPPATRTWSFGSHYERMSTAPLDWLGPFPHRVLGPTIAHALGLGGQHFWIFGHGIVVLLLASLVGAARAVGATWAGATVLATALALSPSLVLWKGLVGYTEPTSMLLLVLSVVGARRTGWFWVLQAAGLLNHEHTLVFWPWLLHLRFVAGGNWRHDLLGAGLVVAAYGLFRWWVTPLATEQEHYSLSFYLGVLEPMTAAGLAIVGAVLATCYFGLLPAIVGWHAGSRASRGAAVGAALFVAATFALCAMARDHQRFVAYLLLPVWLGGRFLLQRPHGAAIVAAIGASNLFVVAQLDRHVLPRFVAALAEPPPPDPVRQVLTMVLPRHWLLFVSFAAFVIVVTAAGWHFGRRDRALFATPKG